MSRVKLMLDVIDDVCAVAESLQGLAGSLRVQVEAVGSDEQPKAAQLAEKAEPKPKTPSKPKAVPEEKPEEKQPTLTEVRAVLAQKSRSGKTAQVKDALIRHGADKLSDIDPAEYKALLADVEVL
ncbi:rRNA biogenesis protein rrp5 [Robinsoniella peoriensis]|uniref:rRNA biogenesis protein rrp5 n=1 Tax=Robinsoniella peoriensis TaxID=180332 RepID=UPI003644979C